MSYFKFFVSFIIFVIFCTACKVSPPRSNFYQSNYKKALKEAKQNVNANSNGKNYAYHRLFLGSVAFEAGNYQLAQKSFRQALKVMEMYGENQTKEMLALIGSERGKTYKGDPYEKMLAHFYTGMTYYFAQNYTKAFAGFTNALNADKMSPQIRYKKDAVLFFFMAAKAALKLNKESSALGFISEALRACGPLRISKQYLNLEKIKQSNLTLIIATGRGPKKRRAGSGQSIEVLVPKEYPESKVEVFLDGKHIGKASKVMNTYFQAKTGGKSKASSIRFAKGVAHDLAAGMPLIQSKADIRAWTFLPGDFFIFCSKVPKGLHTITLKFFDNTGSELKEYRQTWYYCPIKDDSLYYFRSGKNKCFKGKTKSLIPPPIQYCCDATGHIEKNKPYILGGKCFCSPNESLRQSYLDKNIHFDDHSHCNNLCKYGPHVIHGGKCMVSPTPGTQNYEDVIFGHKNKGE